MSIAKLVRKLQGDSSRAKLARRSNASIFLGSALCLLLTPKVFALTAKDLALQPSYKQGAVVRGKAPVNTQVFVGDRALRLSADGKFVFGIGRDTKNDQRLTIVEANGHKSIVDLTVQARRYNIQRVEGVPEKTVNPPEADLARIRKESSLAATARNIDSTLTDFSASFVWPLIGPITGVYGSQRVYNGTPKNPHFGVDVARPTGTVVTAPAGGIVRLAYDDMYFSGGTLIVDHGHGLTSTFMHLSAILVQEGQRIEQGDPIAKVGSTGRATGPHLDWRMNWYEHRVDPQTLVGPMPKQ